ncbi:hypothetical protein F5Y00DRAFT_229991 [Daldinia vernicosa]|uniref:uncharacterized protein n=1 Tax=Daldinia vernicosa TaxID=114800 RepID=UPI0020087D76|nr:uncharacterized protein F5Y00DRAFT_229991 [Daldinia vernicosa]KAI0851521.1 hypothetical protein F5Y00DRAFT_229991 [Daldinia vernicosa]
MSRERRSSSLEAPERKGIEDPGARELASSDSDEHFSDAQSSPRNSPGATSPVPRTRVEKVDDEPSYGEVPGTEAYSKRTEDAEPDEIAIIHEKKPESVSPDRPVTPGGHPIPKTVVDESADTPGSSTRRYSEHLHRADAEPDFIRKPDGTSEASPTPSSLDTTKEATDNATVAPSLKSPSTHRRRKSSAAKSTGSVSQEDADGDDVDDFGDFGDDFDEFEEGDEDADFGDFDDGFQTAEAEGPAPIPVPQPQAAIPSFPILDLDGLDSEDIIVATEPYLDALFSPEIQELPALPSPPKDNPIFFNPRSASLWSQLAAPPPLQPPDWIRSRIRRLFLVSLGVPVDLDEILPASKQKKLVLPSIHRVTSTGSLRTSSESRSVSRLRKPDTDNNSSVSVDSQGKEKPRSASKRQKGPPEAPDLDLVSAKQLCTTTDEALSGMTDKELRQHVKKLQDMEVLANDVLEYWKKRTDEKIGDREAFEGVIENLVKHARKTRK